MLIHSAGTLEMFYLNLSRSRDVIAASLDEPIGPGAHSRHMAQNWASLAVEKPTEDQLGAIGPALNELVDSMVYADDNFPVNATTTAMKNYLRRVRRLAYHTIKVQLQEQSVASMTAEDYASRLVAADASTFAEKIQTRALASMRNRSTDGLAVDDVPDLDCDMDFIEPVTKDISTTVEADAENQFPAGGSNQVTVTLEESPQDQDEGDVDVPFVEQIRAMMQTIIDNGLRENIPWTERAHRDCSLCINDTTASEVDKVSLIRRALSC